MKYTGEGKWLLGYNPLTWPY